jgi:IS30 family transposase
MHDDARECLERAAECARLAEVEKHPELKRYLTKLAASWTRAASETVDAQLQDA